MDMEDILSRFLFVSRDAEASKAWPHVSLILEFAEAVIEINGFFTESKIPLRSRILSLYAEETNKGHINQVKLPSEHDAYLFMRILTST